MKNLILVIVSILAFQVHAQTQETRLGNGRQSPDADPVSGLHLIPVLGGTAMALKGADTSGWDVDGGGSVGGLVELGSGVVGLQTGLLYNQYRRKADFVFATAHLKMDYLSVPVMGKVNLMGNPNRTVYLKAGLMPSFLVSKEATVDSVFTDDTYKRSDIGAKTFDLPVVAGVGGAIPVGRTNNKAIIVEALYVRSLQTISSQGGDVRNEGVIVSAGFAFGI